jgi:3-phosphoshikimate 1-carboxyvinyltransferase
MPDSVTIRRPEGPIGGRITLPRSKSLANRALILAALADDLAGVKDPGEADDVRILRELLTGRPDVMHCGDGATTFRFLLAWACVQEGEEHWVTGSSRLLERPHGVLVDALASLGADISRAPQGYRVRGRRMRGGLIAMDSPVSSQYLSALLLVGCRFEEGLRLKWTGLRLSLPYVRMALKTLAHFGIPAHIDNDIIEVPPSRPKAVSFVVPRDWSAAAFWMEAMALADSGEVELPGLHTGSWQGDERSMDLWSPFVSAQEREDGVLLRTGTVVKTHRYFDLIDTPDLFQPLAFTCAGRGIAATFSGLHNLSLKETDRLQAMAQALRELGCAASYDQDIFTLAGPTDMRSPRPFDPQGDHRMAMGLAPLALVLGEVAILHPEVVAKSYPHYWEDLRRAGFQLEFR